MGYRRIRDELDGHKGIHVNDKRVLRICRKYDIKSNIKWKPKSCTRGDRNPDHIAKNYLHREFHAEKPNEKWLTDVSEFKYYNGIEVHKVYLSAILDLLSDGTLWEGQIALYFRWTCLPDCAVPELDADYRRNNRRLS